MKEMMEKLEGMQLAMAHWTMYEDALAYGGHRKYQERARLCEDFYLGGGRQWREMDILALDERPWLEENLIFPSVNAVLGLQTQSRMDIAYKPRQGGTQKLSDALTKVAMFTFDENRFPWAESQVFSDGLIQQRGYYDIRIDFSSNFFGEIRIVPLDPLFVIPDPYASAYDPDEWNDVIIAKWMDLDSVREVYGDEAWKEVMEHASYSTESAWFEGDRNTFGDIDRYGGGYWTDHCRNRHVKILERQYRVFGRRMFFVNEAGDYLPVPDDTEMKELKRMARESGMELVERTVKRIRWTVSTQHVVLRDDWSPYDHFTVVPYFPYFRRGVTVGMVDNMIKTQEMLNKVFSQIMHVVNTTANSGWMTEEGSLRNMDEEEFKEKGAGTGLHIVYGKGTTPPVKIQSNPIPTGLDNLVKTGVDLMRLISGVSETFLGGKSNEVSRVAIQSKIQQTAVQLAVPIDNLFRTRNMIGERMLELIQKFYTNPRTFLIMTPEENEPNEELAINQPDEETGKFFNDVTVGKYSVVVADVPTQITFQQAQMALAIEMRKYGVNISDKEMVLMSSLSRKKEIVAEITGGQPSPEQVKISKLQLEQLEATVAKLKAEGDNRAADSLRKLMVVAKEIKENPGLSNFIDKLHEMRESADEETENQLGPDLGSQDMAETDFGLPEDRAVGSGQIGAFQ